jgi:hypothetical protein
MPALLHNPRANVLVTVLAYAVLLSINTATAEPVSVKYAEGLMHGFLKLQTVEGKTLAWGETTQVARGDQVTSRLLFRFLDGSIYEETTVFSQRGTFRLVRDRLLQKGPAFKQPTDTTIDVATGQVTVRYNDKDGKEKVQAEHLDLPPDLSNGLMFTLLKDVSPNVPKTTVSMVATTPKPRLVKLVITPEGTDPFSVGKIRGKATHYVVKVEIGGITGAVAKLVGKQPPDTHVWIVEGDAPGFIKFEGPLEQSGPIWQIQMTLPAVFDKR